MASENRAAAALGRAYPGGMDAFVNAMNAKAHELEMTGSRFVEPTGLSSENVSSAGDLAKLVRAAKDYPLIAEYSTTPNADYTIRGRRVAFVNTNGLVRGGNWEIGLSKTGFINAAGPLPRDAGEGRDAVADHRAARLGRASTPGSATRTASASGSSRGSSPPVGRGPRPPRARSSRPQSRSQRTPNGRVRSRAPAAHAAASPMP